MPRNILTARIGILILFFVLGFTSIAAHYYSLQVSRHEELLKKAKNRYTASRIKSGRRGEIFDIGGKLLAANYSGYDILAEPRLFPQGSKEETARILAALLPVQYETLIRRFRQTSLTEIVVSRNVQMATARKVEKLKLPGLRLIPTWRRRYPKGNLFANIIGFTNVDGKGVEGIEKQFNQALQPNSAKTYYEQSGEGIEVALGNVSKRTEPGDGANVYLTIHEPIQSLVREELMKMVEKHETKNAYAIMANPSTGAIMAMVQYPDFNPNDRRGITYDQWRNHIIADSFEPGSIMKSIAVSGAMDYGLVELSDIFDCENGVWFYRNRPLHDVGRGHDQLTVWQILQKSSNIGAAKITLTMGRKRAYQVFRRFGFGEPTGIELPGEIGGIFHHPSNWDGLTLSRLGIGHAISTTPLQMVQAYCALANDGKIPQLHIINRIVYPDGREIRTIPQIKKRALRPGTARSLTRALITVTGPEGTASKAAIEKYNTAGKTGTARKIIDGAYSNKHHIASFIGYVPAEDPAFVLMISADEPSRNGSHGGTVAAPVFRRIAEKTLRYLQVAPTGNSSIARQE